MEINAETYTHYLNAKHRQKSPKKQRSPANKSLQAKQKSTNELLKSEIWSQSMRQMESQLLMQGNCSVPHLGIFWIAKQEMDNLPGLQPNRKTTSAKVASPGANNGTTSNGPASPAKSVTYAVHFLIQETVAPQMYKMKSPVLRKTLPQDPEPLDTRRVAIDLGTVSKERVRTYFRDFARQLGKEIRKMGVSSQVSIPFGDMGKVVFTATNYGVRWEQSFLKKVKTTIRRLRSEDKQKAQAKETNTNSESKPNGTTTANGEQEKASLKVPPSVVPMTENGSPDKLPPLSPKHSPSNKNQSPSSKFVSSFSPNSPLGGNQGFSLPSQKYDEDETLTREQKARMQQEWKKQIREREAAVKRELEADKRMREMNEYVAEMFSETERKKFHDKRSREKRTMEDNLQIAQLVKNIRTRADEIPECGDIFQKRRSDHPHFSKEQLKQDLQKQMIEKQQRLLMEKNGALSAERKEFHKLRKNNQNHRLSTHQQQLRKKEYQKLLLEKQMLEKQEQSTLAYDEERRREMAEQVLVPGHDAEIAHNSKKIAKELQKQALKDAAQKQASQKQQIQEEKSFERVHADYLRQQDTEMKQKAKQKQQAQQKEMRTFWDAQVGASQWKNPAS